MPELEFTWPIEVLMLNIGLLALFLFMQPLVRDLTLGLRYTLSSLDERQTESKLGRRLAMIKDNQIEALALYAPLAILAWLGAFSHPHLHTIASVFLAARLAYACISAAGIPVLRSAAWTVGFLATLYLGWLVWIG